MREITHQRAEKYLQAKADEALQPGERTALETHLTSCTACQAYAMELAATEKHMRRFLQNQWKGKKPLTNPLPVIQSQMRRKMLRKQKF